MDIEDLRTFVEVADAGGITTAARRLGVAKSLVSRRLARLEADLGTQLLSRTTRGAVITESGVIFRDRAAAVCAHIDEARQLISADGDLRGRFRITAPLTLGPTHFAPVIASLAQRHPLLHIQASFTDRFADLIGEGLDCAIRVGHLKDSNLLARRIGWTSAIYVASPDYIRRHGSPATPDDFATHEVVMQRGKTWLAMDGENIITLKPQGRFNADNAVALVSAALAGIGLAGVPQALINEHLTSGALVPVMTQYPSPNLGIYVIRPPGQYPARQVRILTEMLIEQFGRQAESSHAGKAPDIAAPPQLSDCDLRGVPQSNSACA